MIMGVKVYFNNCETIFSDGSVALLLHSNMKDKFVSYEYRFAGYFYAFAIYLSRFVLLSRDPLFTRWAMFCFSLIKLPFAHVFHLFRMIYKRQWKYVSTYISYHFTHVYFSLSKCSRTRFFLCNVYFELFVKMSVSVIRYCSQNHSKNMYKYFVWHDSLSFVIVASVNLFGGF